MDQTINLTFLIQLIRKYWRSVLLSTVVGAIIAGGIVFFVVTPKYRSSVQILVGQRSGNMATQFATQQADVQMITTYKELITNAVILEPTQKSLKQDTSYDGTLGMLKNEISVTSTQNSQVFSINVVDSNAQRSANIANQVAETFKQRVKKIIKVNNVTIVSAASPSSTPISPNKLLYLVVGLMVGMLVGFLYSCIRELTDRCVHDMEFLTDDLELISLGLVNHQNQHRVEHQLKKMQTSQVMETNQRYRDINAERRV